jgi:hypothetical protein
MRKGESAPEEGAGRRVLCFEGVLQFFFFLHTFSVYGET